LLLAREDSEVLALQDLNSIPTVDRGGRYRGEKTDWDDRSAARIEVEGR
jgi:hypothetical protein